MNERNYEFLTRALGKLGFEDKLNAALRTKMELNMKTFDLRAAVTHGKDQMVHELHFDKKKDDGFYFLNSQDVTLTKPGQEPVTQKFTFFNQGGFDNKETYNLMDKRPVRNTKTIDEKPAIVWTYIDFTADKNVNGNYVTRSPKEKDLKFDLNDAIDKLPVQNLSPEEKQKLTQSLADGNLTPATVKVDGRWEKVFLEATPTKGMITAYDATMQKLNLSAGKVELLPDDNTKKLPPSTTQLLNKEEKKAQGQSQKIRNT